MVGGANGSDPTAAVQTLAQEPNDVFGEPELFNLTPSPKDMNKRR